MIKQFVAAGAVLACATLAAPAWAEDNCAARSEIVNRLSSDFSEQLTVGGLQQSEPVETVIEVWSSPETGTFTILLTNPDGTTCIVAAGTDFFTRETMIEPVSQES